MIAILRLLSLTCHGCTPEHIALHTNIPEPMSIIEKLCSKGYVQNIIPEHGSLVPGPRFRITSKGLKRLEEGNMQTVRIPLALLLSTFQANESKSFDNQPSQLEVEQ